MAQYPIRQLTTKQRLMGAIWMFQPHGSLREIKIGPVETGEFTPNITEAESWTNEFGDRRLIGTFTTQKDGSVVLNGIQMWTDWLYQALYMADAAFITQAAAPSQELELPGLEVGYVFRIPGLKATGVTITDANSTTYLLDKHFIFHPKTGYCEITEMPEGALTLGKVTYTLPAITADDKLMNLAIMSNDGVRGKLTAIGVIAGVGRGEEVEMVLPDVQFRPNGAISTGDTANVNTASLTARVYSTAEEGYGYLKSIPKA